MQRVERAMRRSRINRGFTLIELLLVVAIIALIASVGGGMYANSYKKLLVQKTAKQFLLMARYGRIIAIEQGRPYELMIVAAGNTPDDASDATPDSATASAAAGRFFLATTVTNEETGETRRMPVRDYYCKPVALEGDVRFENVEITTFMQSSASDGMKEQKITFLPTGATESAVVQIGDGTWHYTVALMAATGQATLYEGPADKVRTTVVDLDAEQQ